MLWTVIPFTAANGTSNAKPENRFLILPRTHWSLGPLSNGVARQIMGRGVTAVLGETGGARGTATRLSVRGARPAAVGSGLSRGGEGGGGPGRGGEAGRAPPPTITAPERRGSLTLIDNPMSEGDAKKFPWC